MMSPRLQSFFSSVVYMFCGMLFGFRSSFFCEVLGVCMFGDCLFLFPYLVALFLVDPGSSHMRGISFYTPRACSV